MVLFGSLGNQSLVAHSDQIWFRSHIDYSTLIGKDLAPLVLNWTLRTQSIESLKNGKDSFSILTNAHLTDNIMCKFQNLEEYNNWRIKKQKKTLQIKK